MIDDRQEDKEIVQIRFRRLRRLKPTSRNKSSTRTLIIMQSQNAALPSAKRKFSLPSNNVPDSASTATDQQAEPAGKRARTQEPTRGGEISLFNDPASSASPAFHCHVLASMALNQPQLFTEVPTCKNPAARDRQCTQSLPTATIDDSSDIFAPNELRRSPSRINSSTIAMSTLSSLRLIEARSADSNRAFRRKHHCVHVECPIQSQSSSSSVFDSLPWISAMDLSPDEYDLNDIADLSQLPLPASPTDDPRRKNTTTSGAGPAQRQTTSLHTTSSLMAASVSSIQSINPSSVLRNRPVSVSFPSTPRPRLAHSSISFRDLMPLFTCDIHKYRSFVPSSPV
ncbi:hypothetical protein BT96DRAFT_944922 [Gymnopus androsaceus JB14]|uniref:Uncharacterized protein n=1 Tax=Gymnopus androsaceus JB14 TaxID=1447944 RepID=A0A6A4H205_9AGAR|nr:hypothetical protein BT96DRAFT_944922 [Gymnopus androsaceus JB14]